MLYRLMIGVVAMCLMSVPVSAQSPVPRDLAARVEVYSFPTLTISDSQFLTGDENGKEITLTGELSIAQGSGRLPVVVLMHGSGGIGGGSCRVAG